MVSAQTGCYVRIPFTTESSDLTGLILAVLAVITALSHVLAQWMPDIPIQGQTATYAPPDIALIFIPLLMIPLTLTCNLLFPKQTLISKALPFFTVMAGFIFLILISRWYYGVLTKTRVIAVIAALVLGCWAIFIAALRHVCLRRCLGT